MGNVSTEQKLRLVQQVRDKYNEDRYDMFHREQILYGRTSARPQDAPVQTEYPPEAAPRPSFLKIRFFLALLLLGAVIAMDKNGTAVAGITAEKIFEFIGADYEEKIDEWVEVFSHNSP